jgi:hypothetical protein
MDRREFLGAASAAVFAPGLRAAQAGAPTRALKPMALGLLISPFGALEERVKRVRDLGFSNCFLSLDGYIGHFTPAWPARFAICSISTNWLPPRSRWWGRRRWSGTSCAAHPPSAWFRQTRASRAHRCAAAGLGLCPPARHQPGADPLRLHSRRSRRSSLSRRRRSHRAVAQHCQANGHIS